MSRAAEILNKKPLLESLLGRRVVVGLSSGDEIGGILIDQDEKFLTLKNVDYDAKRETLFYINMSRMNYLRKIWSKHV